MAAVVWTLGILLALAAPAQSQQPSKPANPRNRVNFLKANTIRDIESNRGLWRNVAAQLRNRTMPPVETKLSEDDRLRVATWIDNRLRQTACSAGDFAGAVALRRLNRREYRRNLHLDDLRIALAGRGKGTLKPGRRLRFAPETRLTGLG